MNYRFDKTAVFDALPEEPPFVAFDQLLAIARRQWPVVLICAVLAAGLGAAYALTAVPIFTASASILIDSSNKKIVDELSAVTGVLGDDTSILSQVEILKSDKLAQTVSGNLDLKNDPLFMAQRAGPLQNVISSVKAIIDVQAWFKTPIGPAPDPELVQQAIVQGLENGVRITRVAGTYVLTVEYASVNPTLAARIARAYAEAYLTDQLDSKYEATRRASDWLQKRIAELRQNVRNTDLAVQKFKALHGLITTEGQLVSEQQLTQINTQLVIARTETASMEAKYRRIQQIIDAGDMEGAVNESLSSNVINDLRGKYLEASRRETDISARLGERHSQAVRLRQEMGEYKRLMFDELGRIAQSYQNNYEIALSRQKSLETQVATATGVSATANDAQVQLRELEREADSYKKLYETFLQRYQEAVQQQSFPVTEARIISYPKVPTSPSSPKTTLIVALSVFLGVIAGAGLGALREFRDRFFRTGDQIRDVLQLEPLGTVPLASAEATDRRRTNGEAVTHARILGKADSISNYVIDHPLSAFAETMRSAKIAIDIIVGPKRPKLIGVVSVLPGEGKSTVSINLAELLASQGSRVLLIDADLRNPGATRHIGRHAERGILEALEGSASPRDILMINPDTNLAFLPAVVKRRIPYSSELLSSEAMDRMIRDVSQAFDYIILDLPPIAPVVDARAISSKIDTYLFVIEWGKTARNAVRKTLISNAVIAQKCCGVILNKVDTKKMKFYQGYGSQEFYYSKYSSYYRE